MREPDVRGPAIAVMLGARRIVARRVEKILMIQSPKVKLTPPPRRLACGPTNATLIFKLGIDIYVA